jgi:regulator of sigma E protease
MSFLEIILYYVLVPLFVLGIAINIHELGHFLVAKFFGMRVEAYSFFGLGPRLFGFKWGHTDYRISAIPLGAYVKLYGDDATAPLEGGVETVEPVPAAELYELRPRWQKFFVMIGGPFMNIVLSLAIPFAGALMYGVPAMPTPIIGAIDAGSAAAQAGIQLGDRIVNFNGSESPTWRQIVLDAALRPGQPVPIIVERNGERVSLEVTPSKTTISGQEFGELGIDPDAGARPVVIGAVEANSPAAEAGMKTGDRVVSINGVNVRNTQQLSRLVQEGKSAPIRLTIERDGKTQDLNAQVRKLPDGTERLGIGFTGSAIRREPAGIGTAWSHAVNTNLEILSMTATALGQVFTGTRAARDTVSGPIGIFQQSAQAAQTMGWDGIFQMLMAISLSLGVFNLLPIPMLDGGQIFVLAIEGFLALFGLQLSMLVRERIQLAGLAIILLLMVTVFFIDISRLVGR